MSEGGDVEGGNPYRLSPQLLTEIFWTAIVPNELSGRTVARPAVVMFGGQTGAGKSTLATAVTAELGLAGAVTISTDALRAYHPRLSWLLRHQEQRANEFTDPDARAWVSMAIDHVVAQGYNVIFDGTLSRPEAAREAATRFAGAGYRTAVVLVATPAAFSQLGILSRYQDQREHRGHGRFVHNHDETYHGVLATAETIDAARLVDEVRVYRRGGVLLYENHLGVDEAWDQPPATTDSIDQERHRRRAATELDAFAQTATDLADRMGPDWHPQIAAAVAAAIPLAEDAAAARALTELARRLDPAAVQDADIETLGREGHRRPPGEERRVRPPERPPGGPRR